MYVYAERRLRACSAFSSKRFLYFCSRVKISPNVLFFSAKVRYYSRPPEPWALSPHLSREGVATIQEGFNFEELEEDNKNTVNGEISLT